MVWELLVANGPESLSGGAGWVGAGLLGGVLAWLLFIHLPAKDKLMKEATADKDRQIDSYLEHKWAAIQQMSTDRLAEVKVLAAEFRAVIVETTNHCEKEVERLIRVVESQEQQLLKVKKRATDYPEGKS